MTFKKVDPKVSFPKMEEEILRYWDENKIFEKSVANREGAKRYSFYDGPPFATGTPHYGHIVASAIKDTVPRYWTMRGFQVERKWGWDCHGLPIENIAEKALGIKHKKEIEEMGVAKFNETCRSKVLEYVSEWKRVIGRFGRWADMDNAYSTMDKDYMESVWWVFKELWDKGLIYESYRSMHICPRCETTLSQQEVSEGYKDVKDLSVVAKFELTEPLTLGDSGAPLGKGEQEEKTYVLAWTTTPWTLPGNVALAVNKDIEYVKVRYNNEKGDTELFILAKSIYENSKEKLFPAAKELKTGEVPPTPPEIVDEFNGTELIGKSYKPLFDYYAKDETLENRENGWKIYHAPFVTTDMGTGIAHEAPAFGEDDMELGKQNNLPWVQHVKMDGTMKDEVTDFAGKSVKPVENPQEMDIEIVKYLAHKGLLFSKEKYEHSYPHCWRCDTPLLNYATSSWFVSVTKIKERALELAKEINWSPEHVKEGRFGKWLEGARDWSISRQRFWASVMPLWKCECSEMKVFGSVVELEKASGKKVDDLHKHIVDEITVPCEKCGGAMKRVPDVLDTWFDSGSMPYAQAHYPFENKEKFEVSFPAQFIAEGIDQTRAWFYYLHVLATGVKDSNAFQNVIVNGVVLAEDGKKMSKRLQNYPDPMEIIEKHGADALRFYLLSSPIVSAENLNFSERDMTETSRNVFRMLWNSYSFFVMYADIDKWTPKNDAKPSENLLDRWMLSELQILIQELDGSMERYELAKATRLFMPFIDNLSNWYIRRSRKRFWKSEDDTDKEQAYQTLYTVLVTLSKLMAPFTPFLAEEMYRNLTNCHSREVGNPGSTDSVHLAEWPVADEGLIDEKLNEEMNVVRSMVTAGLQLRAEAKIKVRQPLSESRIKNQELSKEMHEILKEELNIKDVVIDASIKQEIVLNTEITEELKLEGEAREIIRAIQEGRKKAGFNVEDRIVLGYNGMEGVFNGDAEKGINGFKEEISKEILATEVKNELLENAEYSESVTIEGGSFEFQLKRTK